MSSELQTLFFYSFHIAKCLIGNSFFRSNKTCPAGKDVCVKVEENGIGHYGCESSETLKNTIGLWGDGCITISSILYCACSGENCDLTPDDRSKSESKKYKEIRDANKLFVLTFQ